MQCEYHEDREALRLCPACKKRLCADCVNGEDGYCWSCSHDASAGMPRVRATDNRVRRQLLEYATCYVASLVCDLIGLLAIADWSQLGFLIALVFVPIALLIAVLLSAAVEWFLEAVIGKAGYYRYAAGMLLYALAGSLLLAMLFGFGLAELPLSASLFLSIFFGLRVLRERAITMRAISCLGFLLSPIMLTVYASWHRRLA